IAARAHELAATRNIETGLQGQSARKKRRWSCHVQSTCEAGLGVRDIGARGSDKAATKREAPSKQVALSGGKSAPHGGGIARAKIDGVEDDGSALLHFDNQVGLAALAAFDE